jgi:transcriptional regulator with XRE-family HTH domain
MYLNYQTIGKRIRILRKQQHLSQMALAEMVDKSPTYISLVENGQKGPSLETLIDVANALKVTTDILLAEHLEQNTAAVGSELTSLLEDCTEYEKRVIVDSIHALKNTLREAKYLFRRR